MHMSELQNKDVLSLSDGKIIGKIIDIIIDDKGYIVSLVVEKYKFIISLFSTHNEIEVPWNKINKIGEDAILVDI